MVPGISCGTMQNKLIILELNELTPRLMSQFIDEGVLPNFAWLRRESATYVTDAGEDAPYLEPWIQWVTSGRNPLDPATTRYYPQRRIRPGASRKPGPYPPFAAQRRTDLIDEGPRSACIGAHRRLRRCHAKPF
jgi:hypothetical protein